MIDRRGPFGALLVAPGRARGQSLPLFALALTALLLSVGVVVDGSFAWVQGRSAQNAADMAALAGARIIRLSSTETFDDGDVAAAIVDLASANDGAVVTGWGTTDGPTYTDARGVPIAGAYVGSGCTTMSCATASGAAIPAAARGVALTTERGWTPFFLRLIGISDWEATAHAVARTIVTSGIDGPCAICLLDLGTVGAAAAVLSANGSILINTVAADAAFSSITADGGSIEIDGILGGAVHVELTANDGSIRVSGPLIGAAASTFDADAGAIEVGGDLLMLNWSHAAALAVEVAGSTTLLTGSTTAPAVTTGGPVSVSVEDPFASLAQPTNPNPLALPQFDVCIGSCTMTVTPTAGTIHSVTVAGDSQVTLHPGLYGLVTLTLGSTAYLEPGTYYFAGLPGGAVADVTSSIVALGPVTPVFLDQTLLAVASPSGLRIDAPSVEAAPSAAYPYPGLAIYGARGNLNTFTLANSATYPLNGTIHAPDAVLTTAAFSDVHVAGHVVVGTYLSAVDASLTVTLDRDPPETKVQLVR